MYLQVKQFMARAHGEVAEVAILILLMVLFDVTRLPQPGPRLIESPVKA